MTEFHFMLVLKRGSPSPLHPVSVRGPRREAASMPVLAAKDVQAKAQRALSESTVYALRELAIRTEGDTLVLSGQVSSFYHKQLAQELVRQYAEGLEVVNTIHVL
jgi:hypothetical protein